MATTIHETTLPALESTLAPDDFASLLQREFKPRTDVARDAVESAVRTLARQALQEATVVGGDVLGTIEGLIA